EKLYIGDRRGLPARPFISADSIELRYAFWPLFSRQLLIKEVRLVKPEIMIEKSLRGDFNFSDLMTAPKQSARPATQPPKTNTGKLPFDLLISSFSVAGGRVVYIDDAAKSSNEVRNLNISVSGFELSRLKPISYKLAADLTYQKKIIPLAVSGKIGLDIDKAAVSLPDTILSIAGEKASIVAEIKTRPATDIKFSVASRGLSVDPLLAIFAAPAGPKKAAKPGELTAAINQATAAIPRNIAVNGDFKINNLTFQKFRVDRIDAALSLTGKVLTARLNEVKIYDGTLSGRLSADLNVPGLSYSVNDLRLAGFNAAPFSNAVVATFLTKLPDYKDLIDKIYGKLDLSASLKGRGVEPQTIMANLSLNGSLALKNGELKRLKTLAEIGKTLKSNSLQQDLKFGGLYTSFSFNNQVITAKALKIEETDSRLYFNGSADLNSLKWVPGNRLTLKLAPALTSDLPKETSIFKDKDGWLELTFELTGDLKKPIPKPILAKSFEAAVGKFNVKVEAAKVEIEQKAKAELASKEAEAKKAAEERLKEEAKGKLKELFGR
ncbi:MAG: AsmA-like C-terminal region-containing protein, partial [Candidatus Margulisbacteria bacterium]|nr:AsmA-like C-terminal region-containing protein [Candidatus Margulisiibacteriota bacterium]